MCQIWADETSLRWPAGRKGCSICQASMSCDLYLRAILIIPLTWQPLCVQQGGGKAWSTGTRCGWCDPDKRTKSPVCCWVDSLCPSFLISLGENASPPFFFSSSCLISTADLSDTASFQIEQTLFQKKLFGFWQDVPHFHSKPTARSHLFNLFSVRKSTRLIEQLPKLAGGQSHGFLWRERIKTS